MKKPNTIIHTIHVVSIKPYVLSNVLSLFFIRSNVKFLGHYANYTKSFSPISKILLFVGLLLSYLSFSFFSFNNQFLLNAQARSDNDDDCSSKDSNIIVGTRPITLGTKCNDVIIACPTTPSATGLGSACGNGDIVRGFEKNDVIQGSIGNDELYGDEGNDRILGSQGSDKIYGGPDTDIIQAGEGADLLVGGNGDDELYGGLGDDVKFLI